MPCRKTTGVMADSFAHDPEKWTPVFGKDHAQNKELERDDDSKKSRHALACPGAFRRRRSILRSSTRCGTHHLALILRGEMAPTWAVEDLCRTFGWNRAFEQPVIF